MKKEKIDYMKCLVDELEKELGNGFKNRIESMIKDHLECYPNLEYKSIIQLKHALFFNVCPLINKVVCKNFESRIYCQHDKMLCSGCIHANISTSFCCKLDSRIEAWDSMQHEIHNIIIEKRGFD